MIKSLFKGLLVLTALLNSPSAFADEMPQTQMSVEFGSTPVVQPLPPPESRYMHGVVCPPRPAAADPWPATTPSLLGGCHTTPEQQRYTADSLGLPAATSDAEFDRLVAIGHFVRIDSPYIVFKKDKDGKETVRPYVLPATAQYAVATAAAFHDRGCGSLVITDAGRLKGEKRYGKEHRHTVHPYGMAVDFRINGLTQDCASWLRSYSIQTEDTGYADSTEHEPPHVHAVVRPTKSALLATR